MKAFKFVKQGIDLDVVEVTLLSTEEYKAADVPVRDGKWWLRSPVKYTPNRVCVVICSDNPAMGRLSHLSHYNVSDEYIGVRPALRINNLKSCGLNTGDKFSIGEHTWTIILDNIALCDDIVWHTFFRANAKAEDAADYDASDIKKWLHNWATENGIVVNAVKTT